jgi:hypothetical protein
VVSSLQSLLKGGGRGRRGKKGKKRKGPFLLGPWLRNTMGEKRGE